MDVPAFKLKTAYASMMDLNDCIEQDATITSKNQSIHRSYWAS